ncbi:MAG: hypothetical protein KF841_08620 [Phycisphaerae bacterium]|nr:hypothetical protein [Phycisphaerae bacterium]
MTGEMSQDFMRSIRRQVRFSTLMRLALLLIIASGIVATPFYSSGNRPLDLLWAASAFAGLTWIGLTALSIKQIRAANQGIVYMANGRLDLAEEQLISAASQFSLYRIGKLRACHNLAVVAHSRGSFDEAAALLDGVIAMLRGPDRSLGKTSRLVLADCRLSLGSPDIAAEVLKPVISQFDEMPLAEQLLLLPIETRCQVATGDYDAALNNLAERVRRAELLDSPRAAQVHALLAEACRRKGRQAEAAFFMRRAQLYADLSDLAEERPGLRDLVFPDTSADNI